MSVLLSLLLMLQAPKGEPWLGLAGSGTLTLPGAATAAPGKLAAATSVDNRDRDPLGIDVFDGRIDFTLGVWPRVFNAYYTSILANVIMFSTCCLTALFLPRRGGSLANLTVWDRTPEPEVTPAALTEATR